MCFGTMRHKIVLFIFAVVVQRCWAQDEFNVCDVTYTGDNPDDVQIDWQYGLMRVKNINDVDKLDLTFTYEGILDVVPADEDGAKYIDIGVDDTFLTIQTNDYFRDHFDEDMRSQPTTSQLPISRKFQLTCNEEKPISFSFTLYVIDTNNNPPTFTPDTLEYKMPMPLVPNIDLTGFGDPIIAEDLDFSDNTLAFVADHPDFDIKTVDLGNRQYQAVLIAKKFIRYTDAQTQITITATDSGASPLQGQATITIIKDTEFSIPDVPAFEHAVYKLQYSNNPPNVDDGGTPIKITTDLPDQVSVSLDDDSGFEAHYESTTQIVTIVPPTEGLGVTTDSPKTLTLTATLDGETTQAAVLIYLPEELVITTLTFTKPFYTATYSTDSDQHTVALDADQVISIQENVNADIKLLDDFSGHFSISKVGDVWTLSVEENVDPDVLKKGGEITLTLDATDAEDGQQFEGFGVVVVKLPDVLEVPRFSKSYYTGNYIVNTEGGLDTVELTGGEIVVNPEGEIVDITVDNPSFTVTKSDSTWQVEVVTNLDPDEVKKGGQKLLSLEVAVTTDKTVEHGFGTLVLNLPAPPLVPTFEQLLYEADYNVVADDTDTLTLHGAITVDVDAGQTATVTIEPSDYSDRFEIVCDTTYNCALSVQSDLTGDDLKKRDIVLSLKATLDSDDTQTSTTNVVITLPEPEIPTFSSAYYVANYLVDGDGNGAVTMTNAIQITSPQDQDVTVSFVEDTEYFELRQDSEDKTIWNVVASANVPESIWDERILPLTLQAQVTGSEPSNVGKSSVIVQYPDDSPKYLKFEDPSYTFTYVVDGDSHSIDQNGETISLSTVEEGVAISIIDGNHKDSFLVEQNTDNTYNIKIQSPLDQTVLDTELDILLVLDAALSGDDDGFTTVLINLPKKVAGVAPKFLAPLYHAEYRVDSDQVTVTLTDGPIQLSSTENIQVTFIDTYAENFAFALDGDPQITVSEPLDEPTIKESQELLLTLQVSFGGSPSTENAVVVLKLLPHVDYPKTFRFDQPVYTFSYKQDGDSFIIDQKGQTISVPNYEEGVTVSISDGNYKDQFEVVQNTDNTFSINVQTPLDQIVLDTELDLLLVLDAGLLGDDDGFATVVINLPKKDAGIAPKFTEAVYKADYVLGTEDGDSRVDTVTLDSAIDFQSEVVGEITVVFKENSENFALTKTADTGEYKLSVSKNLDPADLIQKPDIVLTLQASVEGVTTVGEAVVVINLPKETPAATFTQTVYKASYDTSTDPPTVKITNGPIALTGDYVDQSSISLTDLNGFGDYFGLNDDGSGIIVKSPLDSNSPLDREIVLTLTSSLNGIDSLTSTSAVVIERPSRPEFSTPIYTADYDVETNTVSSDMHITINAPNPSAVQVTVENPYNANFQVINDQGVFTIDTIKPLEEPDLSKPEIYVILDATFAGTLDTSRATLLLKLPDKADTVVPTFSKNYYQATYVHVDDGDDSVDSVAPDITIVSDHAELTEVAVLDPYDSNFKAELTDGVWHLNVIGELDETIWNEYTEIYVTLQATLEDSPNTGLATVILSLPTATKKPIPTFSKPYYSASYEDLDNAEPVEITSVDEDIIQVTLDDYTDYFTLTHTEKQWILSQVAPLDATTLKDQSELRITLTAHLDNSIADGKAALIVQLPEKQAISFDQNVYRAAYTSDLVADSAIATNPELSINIDGVEVALTGDDQEYFAVDDCPDKKCTLSVKTPLPPEILATKAETVIVLTATKTDITNAEGIATVIIQLPLYDTVTPLYFKNSVYSVTYDKDSQQISVDIELDGDFDASAEISLTGENSNLFDYDYADGVVTVRNPDPLGDDILSDKIALLIGIHAERDTSTADTSLVIELPKPPIAPQFEKPAYTATYTISDEGLDEVSIDDGPIDISVVGDGTPDIIIASGDPDGNFELGLDDTDSQWKLTVVKDLDPEIIQGKVSILLNLEATVGDTKGYGAIAVQLPKKAAEPSFNFDQVVYRADYQIVGESPHFSVNGEITVEGESDGVSVVLDGDYKDRFSVNYAEGKVSIDLADGQDLSDVTEPVISVDLVATKLVNAATETEKASLVVTIPTEPSTTLEFTEFAYTAVYTIADDGLDQIKLDGSESIAIQGIDDVSTVDLVIDSGNDQDNFELEADGDHWNLIVKDNLQTDVVADQISVLLTLKATLKSGNAAGSAAVVVELPKKFSTASFNFDRVVYLADYTETDGEPSLVPEKDIIIEQDPDGKVKVDLDGDNKDRFTISYTEGKVTVGLNGDLSDVTDPVISVDIVATKTGETGDTTEIAKASLVVKLPPESSPVLQFSEVAYTATYKTVDDGLDQVSIDGTDSITIPGITDATTVELVIESGDDGNNFELLPDGDHWNLNVKADLDADIIADEVSILLNLKATQGDITGQAGVVIKLPKKLVTATFNFDSVVYFADYTETDGQPGLDPEKDIIIEQDPNGEVKVELSGENKDRFKVSYTDGKVTVDLNGGDLSDVTDPVISVDIVATKTGEETTEIAKASLVVKLATEPSSPGLEFTDLAYTATYTIKDAEADEVDLEGNSISIQGVADASTVDLVIESGDDGNNFELVPDGDHWNLNVKTDLDAETIADEVSILLNLKATKDGTTGQAGVVIKLPKKIATASFYFNSVVYMADYDVDEDNAVEFSVEEDIELQGNPGDSITVDLQGDYKDHFVAAVADGKIDVSLKEGDDLSSIKDPVISVDMLVSKHDGDTVENTKASLVVKLLNNQKGNGGGGGYSSDDDDDSGDKTGLIAAVAVLAVLLVASLVGSAVFYYLKFKRSNSYSNMEEPEPRFTKNTDAKVTKFEHPTRRATGVIKHDLTDETVGETATDEDFNLDKRKSVQFDTINIDELEIQKEEDTDDNEYEGIGSDGESEERRSSRV